MPVFKHETVDKHKIQDLESKAERAQTHGDFAGAAAAYMKAGEIYLDDNALIYAQYCHQAFGEWLKAKEPKRALKVARTVLKVMDDSDWLKNSMEEVLDLKLITDELRSAGYSTEAEAFAGELNDKLAPLGLMLRPDPKRKSPTVCPACGAALPRADAEGRLTCSFCGYTLSSS